MISALAILSTLVPFGVIFLLLNASFRQYSIDVRWMLGGVCALTVVVNLSNYLNWQGHGLRGAGMDEIWGDYLQVLQPVLWGMLFYMIVQSAQRRRLENSRQQMRDLVENMPVILHAYDREGRLLAWNRHAEEVTGFSRDEVLGRKDILASLFPDADYREQLLDECRTNGGSYSHRLRPVLCRQRNEKQVAWYNISRKFPIAGWSNWGIGLDVTEQIATQKALEHMATHDELTGLANRALLRDRLSHALTAAQRNQHKGALLLLDLDHFKMVNDNHGHPVGDQLLAEVGRRLATCVKSTDALARFGGDEFVILLERIGAPEDAAMVAERILAALTAQPFYLFGNEVRVRTSIGITVFPDDDVRLDELIKNVDLALYSAKQAGRNGYHFYSRAMHNKLRWQHRVAEKLREALNQDAFSLQYQPQICISDQTVIAVEALVRWNAFDEVPLSPSVFVPIAENMGLMPGLGRWIVETACRQASEWQQARTGFSMSINLSTIQLYQTDLVETLIRIVEENALDPAQIEFEITETAVMRNMTSAIATMRKLANYGFRISLDDFGTGYSSLSYLKRFPISKIKIDQSFVRGLESDPVDASIVRSVIDLGHSMNMKILAEGVETQGQLDRLGNEGCDYIQGFYYSKPLDADRVAPFVSARNSGATDHPVMH